MMDLYDMLDQLNIHYQEVEHPPVFTVEQAQFIKKMISGVGCKCFFLTAHRRYFLVMLEEDKRLSMSSLARKLGVSHLSFASEDALKHILHLDLGSVTPLGLFYDTEGLVMTIIDQSLEGKHLLCHPCVNTKTMSIAYQDLLRWITFIKHDYMIMEMGASK